MKNTFLCGMGLGFVLGAYLLKHCPVVDEAYNSAESNIKSTIDQCKETIQRKKRQKAAMEEQPLPQM